MSATPLGAPVLDDALPGGGLARAAVHEIAPVRLSWDDGPATGFMLVLLGRVLAQDARPALWIASQPDLHPPGLPAFGVDPARLLLARAHHASDTLWAMETALRSPAVAAVVSEIRQIDRTASRRLHLAAETGRTTGLLLLRRDRAQSGRVEPSAATTRWHIGAMPGSGGTPPETPGHPRWRVELRRCRGGRPADFLVEWNDATADFALVTPLYDGAAALDGSDERFQDVG